MTPYKDNQAAFDAASTHLLTQKKKAMRDPTNAVKGCSYHNSDDLRCGIGGMMPVEMSKSLGGAYASIGLLVSDFKHPDITALFAEVNTNVLSKIQAVHDCYPPEEWRDQLMFVAAYYEFNTEAIEALD